MYFATNINQDGSHIFDLVKFLCRFKGTRNGGILENASYFIFTKRKDGLFEAVPVEEWHSFKPTISYNNLNAEEAEEEFAKYVREGIKVLHGVS